MSTSKPEVITNILAYRVENKAQWVDAYRASSNYTGQLECTNSFTTYQQKRIKSTDGFSEVKAPDGKTIAEKLKDPAAGDPARLAKEALDGALKSDKLETALTDFTKKVKGLNEILAADKPEFLPGEIGSFLLKMKGEAIAEINNQHAEAKSKINDLFANNDEFKNNLQTSLGCSPDQLEQVKADMLASLEKSYKEQRENLEKALEESAKNLFEAARKQFFRLSWLGYNYNRDASMREDMEKQMAGNLNGTSMEFNFSGSDDTLRNVDISKLSVFTTSNYGWFTGAKITKTANGYSVQLNQIFETDDSTRQKIASMVQLMLAEGKDTCTLKINNKDPKRAEEDARLAYEGAIIAGMDPKKISIEVNGEMKMKYDAKGNPEKTDLFKGYEQRLQFAQGKATSLAEKLDRQIKGTEESTRQIKQRLQAMQSSGPAPTATPPVPTI